MEKRFPVCAMLALLSLAFPLTSEAAKKINRATIDQAFARIPQFQSAQEFLDFFRPSRVPGFEKGNLDLETEQYLAKVIYSKLQSQLPQLERLSLTGGDLKALLAISKEFTHSAEIEKSPLGAEIQRNVESVGDFAITHTRTKPDFLSVLNSWKESKLASKEPKDLINKYLEHWIGLNPTLEEMRWTASKDPHDPSWVLNLITTPKFNYKGKPKNTLPAQPTPTQVADRLIRFLNFYDDEYEKTAQQILAGDKKFKNLAKAERGKIQKKLAELEPAIKRNIVLALKGQLKQGVPVSMGLGHYHYFVRDLNELGFDAKFEHAFSEGGVEKTQFQIVEGTPGRLSQIGKKVQRVVGRFVPALRPKPLVPSKREDYEAFFSKKDFSSAHEIVEYFNPKRVPGFPDEMIAVHIREMGDVLFRRLEETLPRFFELNPHVEHVQELLSLPRKFYIKGKVAGHDDPVLMPAMWSMVHDVYSHSLSTAKTFEQWQSIANFRIAPAAEWEEMQSGMAARYMNKAIELGDPSLKWLQKVKLVIIINQDHPLSS